MRNRFHTMFVKVVENKLYLESNFERLQKFRHQVSVKLQQAKTRKQSSKPIAKAREKLQQQQKNEVESPFKKQPSPRKSLRTISPKKE